MMERKQATFQVWHARDDLVGGWRVFFGLPSARWPYDYVHVADVMAGSLGEVFEVTQQPWEHRDSVKPCFGKPGRSTSVGDVVVETLNGEVYRCVSDRWKLIDWAR